MKCPSGKKDSKIRKEISDSIRKLRNTDVACNSMLARPSHYRTSYEEILPVGSEVTLNHVRAAIDGFDNSCILTVGDYTGPWDDFPPDRKIITVSEKGHGTDVEYLNGIKADFGYELMSDKEKQTLDEFHNRWKSMSDKDVRQALTWKIHNQAL